MVRTEKLFLRKKDLFFALLIITYGLRAYTDAVFVSQGIDSIWTPVKYVTLILAVLYGVGYVLSTPKKLQCTRILYAVGFTCFVFVFISLIKMVNTGVYSLAVFKIVLYLLQSAVVSVLILTLGDQEDIYNFMRWLLMVCFAFYCIFDVGLRNFTMRHFQMISFRDSYSPFESSAASGTAVALCTYFCYNRRNKFVTVLSLIFALLIFKRLSFIFVIFIFVLPAFVDTTKHVSKIIPTLCAVGFCIATLVYYWFLIPQNQAILMRILDIDSMVQFTSGRSQFFSDVYSHSFFVNFGWGSCFAYLGRGLELELIQMLIEVSFVGLAVFSFSYWSFAGTTIYGILCMAFNFLNLLTSHSLQNGFTWTIILVSAMQFHTAPCIPERRLSRKLVWKKDV